MKRVMFTKDDLRKKGIDLWVSDEEAARLEKKGVAEVVETLPSAKRKTKVSIAEKP